MGPSLWLQALRAAKLNPGQQLLRRQAQDDVRKLSMRKAPEAFAARELQELHNGKAGVQDEDDEDDRPHKAGRVALGHIAEEVARHDRPRRQMGDATKQEWLPVDALAAMCMGAGSTAVGFEAISLECGTAEST